MVKFRTRESMPQTQHGEEAQHREKERRNCLLPRASLVTVSNKIKL